MTPSVGYEEVKAAGDRAWGRCCIVYRVSNIGGFRFPITNLAQSHGRTIRTFYTGKERTQGSKGRGSTRTMLLASFPFRLFASGQCSEKYKKGRHTEFYVVG